MDNNRYNKRGVSASKSEIHGAIKNLSKGLFPNAFCKVLPDISGGDEAFANIMHADTAGTKTSLAYIYWRETGDMTVWQDIVLDAIVMNIDDMACVGAIDNIIISSTIGRNKHLISGEIISKLINASQVFIDKMNDYGVSLHLAGGETADVGDIVRTVDVGITAFARIKKDELIINDIQDKDVIVGLASYGQATYEDRYNSGMGSNGLTSARHDIFNKIYREKYPESYAPETDKNYIYSGKKLLTDKIEIEGQSIDLGKFVLSPTRTYLPVLSEILKIHRKNINGIIHCTGGGQTKVMKFVQNRRVIKDNLFKTPELFSLIQNESNTSRKEMYEVFNMGHRMEIYLPQQYALDIIDIASQFNIDARIIGRVEETDKNELIIRDEEGEYMY